MFHQQKNIGREKGLEKLMRFCAYQERTQWEVRQKIKSLGLSGKDADWIEDYLIEEKFFDDQRFAQAYVRGKFNQQKWGKIKIKLGLKQKGVASDIAETSLATNIDEEQYAQTLLGLLEKKLASLDANEEYLSKKAKLIRFAIGRGFEPSLIEKCAQQVLS